MNNEVSYKVKMVVTDCYGCDALDIEVEVVNAHSFSEALVIAERQLTINRRLFMLRKLEGIKATKILRKLGED